MCGICGIAGQRDPELVQRMTRTMVHRGPDDEGFYSDQSVSLGMRRLSIIDLESGHQPITNEDQSVWVIFNGEIYNYRELRASLEKKGHRFATGSDTEVIAHAYEEYGEACVHALRGMFTFALWDRARARLLLARDRLGIKPLYYWISGGVLVFGSEIKAILAHPGVSREVNVTALDLYLTLQYVPAPWTMFEGIQKLLPGHLLVWGDREARIERYWDVVFLEAPRPVREADAVEALRERLEEAVRYRLIADVPLGALLSGGVDSSVIVALMARAASGPVKTFTVGFDVGGKYNELEEARLIAKRFGTDHHELVMDPRQAQEWLPKLIWHLDEPLADRAFLPTFLICRFARERVKVVLTGEGGDELFAGYPRYAWFRAGEALSKRVPAAICDATIRLAGLAAGEKIQRYAQLVLTDLPPADRHLAWVGNFVPDAKSALWGPALKERVRPDAARELVDGLFSVRKDGSLLHRLMYLDIKTWLVDDILHKVDKMSMATSLEARVPLLDHKLVEFVATLPAALKLPGFQMKRLLKEAVKDLIPAGILNRRKHAFQVPVAEWFRGGLRELLQATLLSADRLRHGFFNIHEVGRLVGEHLGGRGDHNQCLWNLVCFQLWYEQFIESKG
jgi:asparagine synthase (glutamine-hydrolysing)